MDAKACLGSKVIIRIAEPNDLPEIFRFCDEYSDGLEINRDKAKNSLRDILYLQGVLMFDYEGKKIGGVAGYVMPCMFTDDVMFSIMFFYVRKEFRFLTKQIIKEIELVMLPTKATKIVFGVPMTKNYNSMIRYFRMMGYTPLETHMEKRI